MAGSSPRVRGTPAERVVALDPPGIIPACAGNTHGLITWMPMARDHPRVCGEHTWVNYVDADGEGSSPRVRGTPALDGERGRRLGIIPACAGNTATVGKADCVLRDHPRVCGEHAGKLTTENWNQGSSPRVRGTPCERQLERGADGIIPACAGNTEPIQQGIRAAQGSSPRVRGTLPPIPAVPRRVGIIPACAGNTSASGSSRP